MSADNGGTYTITSLPNNEYRITLTAPTDNTNTNFFINRTTSNDSIVELKIYSDNAFGNTAVWLGSQSAPLNRVNNVSIEDDDGYSFFRRAHVADRLSNVEINGIQDAELGSAENISLVKNSRGAAILLDVTIQGDLLGNFLVERSAPDRPGEVNGLTVLGRIGTPSNPGTFKVGGYLFTLLAGEINAPITGESATGVDSYIDQIFQIEVRNDTGQSGDINGDIRGFFTDFLSNRNYFIKAEGKINSTIYIGDSFFEKVSFMSEVRSSSLNGLPGRVIVNALDVGGGWTADVFVGPPGNVIALDGNSILYPGPGEYPNTAASLGGGSVGVVPFRLHRTDCAPVDNAQVLDMNDRPSASNPIKVRFYGPVNWDTEGSTQPFKIERRGVGSTGAWSNVSSCFTQTLDSGNDTIVKLTPTGAFTPLPRGYEYRVSLNRRGDSTPVLRSNIPTQGVATDPAVHEFAWVDNQGVVAGAPMKFAICDSNAAGDADDSGTVNFSDTTSVLANFGLSGCNLGDADRSGTVDFADLTSVLANFGSMYCVSSGLRFAGEGEKFGVGRVEMHSSAIATAVAASSVISSTLLTLGYESIDAFVDTISQMSEADRNAEVQRLGQLLEAGQGGVD